MVVLWIVLWAHYGEYYSVLWCVLWRYYGDTIAYYEHTMGALWSIL